MGVTVSRDVLVLRDARIVAEASWHWLGSDRQEEMYRLLFGFCVQQNERPAIQKLALAFPYDVFRMRAKMMIDNLFKPYAKMPTASQPLVNQHHLLLGGAGGMSVGDSQQYMNDPANNPDAVHALYTHLGIIFSQMGLAKDDVILLYDLLLDALLAIGDDALSEDVGQQVQQERQEQRQQQQNQGSSNAALGACEWDGGGGDVSENVNMNNNTNNSLYRMGSASAALVSNEDVASLGAASGTYSLSGVTVTRSDLTPQRPVQRPQSGGGGSLRSRQHARTQNAGGESSPNASTVNHFNSNAGNASGTHFVGEGRAEVTTSNQFNTVFGSALLGPPPGSTAIQQHPLFASSNSNVQGPFLQQQQPAPPSPLFERLKWSIREQKAWATLIRHSACDKTLEAHAKGVAAMQLLTSSPTGVCPRLRGEGGEIFSAECQYLTEMLFPTCFAPTSFIGQQLGKQCINVTHVCTNGRDGGVASMMGGTPSASTIPILERRQRFVTLRHRYLYIYDAVGPATSALPSSQQQGIAPNDGLTIQIDEPVAVLDVDQCSRDISVKTIDTSMGVDRFPMYALTLTMKGCGASHTFYFNSAIRSGSWQEAIGKSMSFFATNLFFDSPPLPSPPQPKGPSAAQLAAMGSASFADAIPLMSQASNGFVSASRNARFMHAITSDPVNTATAGGSVYSQSSQASPPHSPLPREQQQRRFSPTTDVDFVAAFRNSFPFRAKLGDFEFFELLGAGNFGRVVRCQHIYSKWVFALKIIRKERFKGIRNVLEVRRERKVLETADNPYIMKIHRTYQTRTRVYFLLDYLPGGELLRHTNKSPGHRFNEQFSKFVLAELACACEYMRLNNIIHRDIKGDNLVLDENGHLILTDFGFAKQLLPGKKHKTCCGTLAYIAPEMLLSNNPDGYGYQVDWWSSGVVLFTVLTGFFPFLKSRRKDTIDAITTQPLQFPQRPAVSDLAMDLCHKLLDKDPTKRYSTLAQIKAHPWYAGFDWEAVESKALPPPYETLLHAPTLDATKPAATTATPADGKAPAADAPPPPPPAATPHDEVTLEQELKDAATVQFECADDVRREEDIFGSFLDTQEDAGSNREDDSGDSIADSDTDDEWHQGGSDNEEEDSQTQAEGVRSTMSGSISMARPRGYSSSSLIR